MKHLQCALAALTILVAPALARPVVDDIAQRLAEGAPATTPAGQLTALEKYIRADDGAFSWSLAKSMRIEGKYPGEWHSLRMTSQLWRSAGEVSVPKWTHWVNVWVPDALVSDKPILFIGGGSRKEEVPSGPPKELEMFAPIGAVVIAVDNIPNQPMKLGTDPEDRDEDGFVARTWARAMETGDATWLVRFAMVKSAVKAIDAFEAFAKEHPFAHSSMGGKKLDAAFKPGKYLVAGGSKRGWTTWLTGAVDDRVGAIVPLVIDVLDVPAQMKHHHEAYGFWAPALNDYVETGMTDRFDHLASDAAMQAVLAHEDPINWLSRVGSKPKMLINATGDEFFVPDSSQQYADRLPAPWRLRYLPNTGHSLKGTSAALDLGAFYLLWASGSKLPELTWRADPITGGKPMGMRVHVSDRPDRVRLWSVTTKGPRDFRVGETGKTWTSTDIEPESEAGLDYSATLQPDEKAFRAGFVEVIFAPTRPGLPSPTFTTSVYVLPPR